MKPRLAAASGEAARIACDLAAFLVPVAIYIASASREPGAWDVAELQGVPYILGISHPTGFPFFVFLGYAWTHLVPFGTIAFRMNAMCGVAMAAAALAAYALALELGAPRLFALLGALWFALAHDVWAHAAHTETQDVAVALCAFSIYAIVRWMRGASDRWLLLAFGLYGLALATHPNSLWILPGLAAGALLAKRRVGLGLTAGAAVLVVAGLSLYLYLPLRSWYVVSHGVDPAHVLEGVTSSIYWNYNDPRTLPGLRLELTGSESGTPSFFLAAFSPSHYQDALWSLLSGTATQYGAFALVIATAGFVGLWKREWRIALVLLLACSAALLFAVTYANESDVGRYKMLALWFVAPMLALAAPRSDDIAGGAARIAYAAFLAFGIGFAFWNGRGAFKHPAGEGGRWVIDAVRDAVPPGSVILADWLDATSLAYGAYADRSLPDRIVVSGWKAAMFPYYRQWARKRRVFIMVDPREGVLLFSGANDYRTLDSYHELYEVRP